MNMSNVLYLFVAVNFICDDADIQAISFVGSDRAGQHIYERGALNGKRVQSNMVGVSAVGLSTVLLT